jgi:hypothetical protein
MDHHNNDFECYEIFLLPILQGFQRKVHFGNHELARLWQYYSPTDSSRTQGDRPSRKHIGSVILA